MRALASLAERGGHRYFMITNADIMVTQAAIDLIEKSGKETYAFSRLDVDRETGRELEPTLSGLDAFAFEIRWWRANQHRFRTYIMGEACWDVVYVRDRDVPRRRPDCESRARFGTSGIRPNGDRVRLPTTTATWPRSTTATSRSGVTTTRG